MKGTRYATREEFDAACARMFAKHRKTLEALVDYDGRVDMCDRCGETQRLAKVKGCVRCLACGYKGDCNGW